MTPSKKQSSIEIQQDGRLVAAADVEAPDDHGVAHSALHVESGPLPPGTRARLVDAVLDSPEIDHAARLVATMPAGDTQMLDRVRERGADVSVRNAGATKLVETRLPEDDAD